MNKTIMHHSYNTDFTVINESINDIEVNGLQLVDPKVRWKLEFEKISALFSTFTIKFYCGNFKSYCNLRRVNSFEAMISLFEDYEYEKSLF